MSFSCFSNSSCDNRFSLDNSISLGITTGILFEGDRLKARMTANSAICLLIYLEEGNSLSC